MIDIKDYPIGKATLGEVFPAFIILGILCSLLIFLIWKLITIIKNGKKPKKVVQKNTKSMKQKTAPKCNCDGCPKQETCEYGHVVYDDITSERMTLTDKFIMLSTFDYPISSLDISAYGEIINPGDLHNYKKITSYSKDILQSTLTYLQDEKKSYLSYGKCGRSYFNFMKMNVPLENVKKAIKECKSK